jgi:primosomal protein N' (replication factor Y)
MAKLHNMTDSICKVALDLPLYSLFDYLAPLDGQLLLPGTRVVVPFGRLKKVGVLIELVSASDFPMHKLKRVLEVLDQQPLLTKLDLQLLTWASHYYHYPLGSVIAVAFPALLRRDVKLNAKLPAQAVVYYSLTLAGKAISSEQLQRAPLQRELIQQCLHCKQSISTDELKRWHKHWRAPLTQLLNKGFIAEVTISSAQSLPMSVSKQAHLQCNAEQQEAITAVTEQIGTFNVFLLEGVTGSGKTEVYMQIIDAVLTRGLQVLVLVPEITLTPQLEARFRQRFSVEIVISHSKLTDKQRYHAWLKMQQGSCQFLLGTRSALFTPLTSPGIIIIDEEHDASFKQQDGFRFSARDVAVVRAKLLHIPILLGSATPSLESIHNVNLQRYQRLHLSRRAGHAIPPIFQVLDIRNKQLTEGLSEPLLAEMAQTLAKKQQVLVFLNRRGFAPTLICHGCGWVARCFACDANLVIHRHDGVLRCHHCAQESSLPTQCPACHVPGGLIPLGLGTERVEISLQALFPTKRVVRVDRDAIAKKGHLENVLEQINQGEVDIILGTQMLAKGHHFSNVTLVALLDVDSGLFSVDFHAEEKLAQLIVQVAGRAGREDKPGKVILQTRHPDHPLLMRLIQEGYPSFTASALAQRQLAQLPPFSFQALFRAQAEVNKLAKDFLTEVVNLAKDLTQQEVALLGPVAAPMIRRAGVYRYQLLVQSSSRQALQRMLTALVPKIEQLKLSKKVRWSLDVDPIDLY